MPALQKDRTERSHRVQILLPRNVITIILLLAALLFPSHAFPRCDSCPRDKYGHIQRSASTKAKFKKLHPCPSTGLSHGACKGYVIDHIVALKRGGADAPYNMQWQTSAEAKAKDKWE